MRFWAEHPEDAERVAKEGGDFNEAFIDHPDAPKAIRQIEVIQQKYMPVITDFTKADVGKDYVIFKTTVEELVARFDNTPVIDAQIRALEAALTSLKKEKETK